MAKIVNGPARKSRALNCVFGRSRTNLLAAVALASIVPGAGDQARAEQHYAMNPGSCGTWGIEQQGPSPSFGRLQAWVIGYVSGVAVYLPGAGNMLVNVDPDSISTWVTSYCAAHPFDPLSEASQLVAVLLTRAQGVTAGKK